MAISSCSPPSPLARREARPRSLRGRLGSDPILFVIGFALQHVLFNRTLGRDLLPPLLVTFGLSIIIQNGLLQLFSADSQRLHSGAIETASISLGGRHRIGVLPLLTLLSAIAVIVLLNLVFYRTPIGRAFRATDDLEVAQLMGLDISRVFAMAMGLPSS